MWVKVLERIPNHLNYSNIFPKWRLNQKYSVSLSPVMHMSLMILKILMIILVKSLESAFNTKQDHPENITMKDINVTITFGICKSSIERSLILLRFHNELKITSGKGRRFYKYIYDKYI